MPKPSSYTQPPPPPPPPPSPPHSDMILCQVSASDHRYAEIALSEANKSQMKYHRHGCVAVMNGRIIERGFNSDRCHSSDGFLEDACSCHAEVDVIRKLSKRMNKKKHSSVSRRDGRSWVLRARQPVRCKKRQARGEI